MDRVFWSEWGEDEELRGAWDYYIIFWFWFLYTSETFLYIDGCRFILVENFSLPG